MLRSTYKANEAYFLTSSLMPHPHQSFLDEFNISIKHLVPLTPDEITEEAKALHKELSADEGASEKSIHQALSLIGRKEYP